MMIAEQVHRWTAVLLRTLGTVPTMFSLDEIDDVPTNLAAARDVISVNLMKKRFTAQGSFGMHFVVAPVFNLRPSAACAKNDAPYLGRLHKG